MSMRTHSCVFALFAVALALRTAVAAVPQLANHGESVSALGLNVKVFVRAEAVPAATPSQRYYTMTKGGETRKVTRFNTREIWLMSQRGGVWRNKAGDMLILARPSALLPESLDEYAERDKISAAIKAGEAEFSESAKDKLYGWIRDFAELEVDKSSLTQIQAGAAISAARQVETGDRSRIAAVFRMRTKNGGPGPWNWVEFRLAEPISPKEGKTLLSTFLKGVAVEKADKTGAESSEYGDDPRREDAKRAISGGGGWWWSENEDYIFLTNMTRSKGEAFMRDTQRTMSAMRKAYERYVPATKPVGTGVVRVFSDHEEYRKYLSTFSADSATLMESVGLWAPSREELLVEYREDKGTTLETMRHEAFHQYLYYATGGVSHMTWFNEGHATLFENVRYNPGSGEVRVLCAGNRADWVKRDPERIAATIRKIITMSRDDYYSGDVNDHYVAGWALCYFLSKGVHKVKGFEMYREVIPAYLKGIEEGLSPDEANERAWKPVADRDISADFLKFWKNARNAETYEPKKKS